MIPVLPAIAIGSAVLVADQIPVLDVTRSCRAAAGTLGIMKEDISSCMQSENAARDQLARQWSSFPPQDRAGCTRLTRLGGTGGTFTELITCLEIKRDAAKLPKESGTTGQVAR